jgi:hypothetical protein
MALSNAFVVIMGVLSVALVIMALICLVRYCTRRGDLVGPPTRAQAPSKLEMAGLTENLIPPVFYTEQLQDPLHQADLSDHIRYG